MTAVDLEPAARRVSKLVAGVTDDQLGDPSPCPKYTVAFWRSSSARAGPSGCRPISPISRTRRRTKRFRRSSGVA